MSDRIVYLRDLVDNDSAMVTGESTAENGDIDDYNLGANGLITSYDSPSMVMCKSKIIYNISFLAE